MLIWNFEYTKNIILKLQNSYLAVSKINIFNIQLTWGKIVLQLA